MGLSPGIRPLQRHRRTDLLQNTQRPHCKLIQGNLAGLFRQAAGGGDGQDGFGIVLVGHRQLYQSLTHHRVREGADGTQSDGTFDVGVLGEQIGLMVRQAAVKDMAGGAVGVLVVEQKRVLHRPAQQEHKGVQAGDQRHRQS